MTGARAGYTRECGLHPQSALGWQGRPFFFHLDFGIREMRRKSIFEKHTHTHISHLSSLYFKSTLRNMYVLYLLEHFVL